MLYHSDQAFFLAVEGFVQTPEAPQPTGLLMITAITLSHARFSLLEFSFFSRTLSL